MHFGWNRYLASPYDPAKDSPQSKPWAYKRFRQGQAKPWTDEFEAINFELSNETWNWLFNPWVFESMSPEQVAAQERTMKASAAARPRSTISSTRRPTASRCKTSSPTFTAARIGFRTRPGTRADGRTRAGLRSSCSTTRARAISCRLTRSKTPTTDVEAFNRCKAMKDVPLPACYATCRGDRVNVFVLSRKLDNYPQRGDDGLHPGRD